MKTLILLSLVTVMSTLNAKDCHDCSVNKNPEFSSIPTKPQVEISKVAETEDERKLRNSLCLYASSGKGNWNRFYKKFSENKIEIEKYYIDNKCGNNQNYTLMHFSISEAGSFGVDFLKEFLKYLEGRQKETGDDKIIHKLLNLTFNPERETTLLDELKISGFEPDLKAATLIEKYGAKSYKQLTDEEKLNGFYVDRTKVAKK